ncbi:MAG: hypothetical protein ACRDV9_05690 [Acidimicrobiia bacterium]
MSTIWTPSGEYTPKPEPQAPPSMAPPPPPPGVPGPEPSPEEMEAMAAEISAALARPMADHVLDLIEQLLQLASLHLNRRALTGGQEGPDLAAASLAIDALGALIEGVGARLGEYHQPLTRTLEQLRMAFVQVSGEGG